MGKQKIIIDEHPNTGEMNVEIEVSFPVYTRAKDITGITFSKYTQHDALELLQGSPYKFPGNAWRVTYMKTSIKESASYSIMNTPITEKQFLKALQECIKWISQFKTDV
ncbi:MAG: hypothetical protein ABJF65_00110 [Reichenbachiella sp.]|uniref:hypothetical protein n=1 Tax=Reichenbachiella sp. TaxID=2184521 RepID=UPI0032668B79